MGPLKVARRVLFWNVRPKSHCLQIDNRFEFMLLELPPQKTLTVKATEFIVFSFGIPITARMPLFFMCTVWTRGAKNNVFLSLVVRRHTDYGKNTIVFCILFEQEARKPMQLIIFWFGIPITAIIPLFLYTC